VQRCKNAEPWSESSNKREYFWRRLDGLAGSLECPLPPHCDED